MDPSSEQLWHFAGVVLTILIAAAYGRIGRAGAFWQIVCRLPGTFLHELAHYIVALVTGGRPSGFTIIPLSRNCRAADGFLRREWVLGSVTMRNPGPLSAMPTGLAPLLLVVAAWMTYIHWFEWFPRDLPHTLGLYVVVCVLCCGSVPSARDLKVAVSSLTGLVLYVALATAAFCFLQI